MTGVTRARPAIVTTTLRRWTPALAALLALAAGLFALDPSPAGVYYDDAHYVLLGRALATGEGYRYLNLPGAPFATHYPPGYPVFLALLWRIAPGFPANLVVFKLANVAFLGVAAVCTARFARDRLGLEPVTSLAAAACGVATIPMLFLGTMVLSEPLFVALLLPFLVWAERAAENALTGSEDARARRDRLVQAISLGAAAGALALVRSQAVVLPLAIALIFALRGRRREAVVVGATSIAVMAPWLVWVAQHDTAFAGPLRGQYGSYATWLREGINQHGVGLLLATARRNAVRMVNDSAIHFQLGRMGVAHVLAVVALVVGALAGVRALARRAPITLAFLTLYLALVVVWPFWPMRFVFGVWPLLALLLAAGLHAAWRQREAAGPQRFLRLATLASGTILAAGACWATVLGYRQAWWSSLARANARPLLAELEWIARTTRPTDVIGTVNQPAVFLYTGRRAVPIAPFTAGEYVTPRAAGESRELMRALLRAYPADVVVATTPETWSAAAALAAGRPASLVPMDTLPRIGVAYRRARMVTARETSAP